VNTDTENGVATDKETGLEAHMETVAPVGNPSTTTNVGVACGVMQSHYVVLVGILSGLAHLYF